MPATPDALFRAWTEQLDRWFAAPRSVLMQPGSIQPFSSKRNLKGWRHSQCGRLLRLNQSPLIELTAPTIVALRPSILRGTSLGQKIEPCELKPISERA
jgi:hypothetical protein